MTPKEMAILAAKALDEKKGKEISAIEITDLTTLADYFVIATGTSNTQINALCGALVGVLSWLSNDAQLRQLSLWGMGSLGQAEWPTLLVAATLIIPAALAVWWMASRLNLLQLGDEEAHYLGVNVQALQRWLLLCSAVLVAVAVAISGVIGFIGLVVPHLMRLWPGPDHRGLIPGSLLAGAILLLLADTLARTVAAPAEIPVGLLTSLLGAPWFLWLVFRRENSRHG